MSQHTHDPYHALRFRDFRLVLMDDIVRSLGGQMLTVALGWEMYDRTPSALALGLIALAQFVPLLVLAPLAGHLADRYNRKHVIILTQLVGVLTSLGFARLSYWHGSLVAIYDCLLVMGMGEAFHDPASHALPAKPDAMRGRVAAIEGVCTSASNQLGGLESGVTAQLFGPVVSVVGGGIATMGVVLVIAVLSPALRQLDTLLATESSGQHPAYGDDI
jgi:MFS family permease